MYMYVCMYVTLCVGRSCPASRAISRYCSRTRAIPRYCLGGWLLASL